MTQSRVPLRTVVKNQLPLYVIDEFPLIGDFLSTYYLSQDFQGAPLDLIQNIDRYVKLDNNANTISSTILLNDITAIDNTIIVSNTKGFPDEYGLIRIDDEIKPILERLILVLQDVLADLMELRMIKIKI